MAARSAESVVRVAAHAALEKRAIDLVVLNLEGLSTVADFFLVCSARSAPPVSPTTACCVQRLSQMSRSPTCQW